MSNVVSTRAQKCTALVCEFNLRVIGAQRRRERCCVSQRVLIKSPTCVFFNFALSLSPCQPVFLSFRITAGAGKPNANKHKCCVVQWCRGKYEFFFIIILPIVAIVCFDLLDFLMTLHLKANMPIWRVLFQNKTSSVEKCDMIAVCLKCLSHFKTYKLMLHLFIT